MPRWKALPEELDPQVKEFAGQLRRLVDRSGLSLAALADRTGYSKTSWERYLNGRLLAPRGAIVALAEVTGTNQSHLTTMWELAERAWSRAEMRHDMTMEAIRISQARAALGEAGTPPAAGGRGVRAGTGVSTAPGSGAGREGEALDGTRLPSVPAQRGPIPTAPRRSSGPTPGVPQHGPADGFGPAGPGSGGPGSRRRLTMLLVGLAGALLVIVGAVLLADPGGDEGGPEAKPSASPTTKAPVLPAGVECAGADCTGQDPEAMGCGGELARTVSTATVGGSLVEVRYSKTCAASWARITKAAPGDTVRISAGADGQDGTVGAEADTDAYTPMVAVKKSADATACATLASGTKGCTTPR
ncbi:XRE family transcriptional regulator [Streptomyces sp. NBC_00234]|uniref:XRE family transcriptional regulator n=1 Tax=Streptomyces sp. NBC_00234 TaxID=2903638 RepID=UPI002E2A127B|nr:XRE family transcriptional regulator [Streptomyces sp. NBC_00234]